MLMTVGIYVKETSQRKGDKKEEKFYASTNDQEWGY
jgi:hypothetical protein